MKINIFRGALYKNFYLYNLQNFLKRGTKRNLRFEIINGLIKKKSSLIDVCGGCGWLKNHLYQSIAYTSADASEDFGQICKKKNINFKKLNFKKIKSPKVKYDYAVMIISLYHFKKDLKAVVKYLKNSSKRKVIIVEEFKSPVTKNFLSILKKKIIDYLCQTNFYNDNYDLFSLAELKNIMKKNNFILSKKFIKQNILVGIFNIN